VSRAVRVRRRLPHGGARELAVFALAYAVYFGVRAITEGGALEAGRNAMRVLDAEQRLGIAWEGAVQRAAMGSDVAVAALNAVYMYGHWPVIIVAGVLLFRLRRDQYRRLRDACLLSGLVGLIIFGVFPVAPPRLTDLPLVDTITRDDAGYRQIVPPSLVNEYAAMPSFHAGWNLLVGIAVFAATRHWLLRTLAVVGPAAMMVAVVATANHYVLDVAAGVALALLCLLARDLVAARSARRRTMDAGDDAHEIRGHAAGGGVVPRGAPGRQRPRHAGGGTLAGHAAHRGGPASVPGPRRGAPPQDGRAGAHPVGSLEAGVAPRGAPPGR
jgi:membrane-associated phospholipid phosphatase